MLLVPTVRNCMGNGGPSTVTSPDSSVAVGSFHSTKTKVADMAAFTLMVSGQPEIVGGLVSVLVAVRLKQNNTHHL